MANSGAIKYNDLAEEGAFEKIIENAEKFVNVIEKMDAKVIKMATDFKSAFSSGTPNSLADVENLTKATKKVEELSAAHDKLSAAKKSVTIDIEKARLAEINLQKAREKAFDDYDKKLKKEQQGRDRQAQAIQKAVDALKKETAAAAEAERPYNKLSATLNNLRKEYKDLAVTNEQNTVAGKALLANITELDAKIKYVDESVGQHQRNVGNYHGAITTLGKGLKGVTGILGEVGAALGLNTELMESLVHTGKEIAKGAKEIHHSIGLEKLAHVENTAAIEGQVAAQEELDAAQSVSIGTIGLAVAAVAALAAGIYYLATADQESEEAVKAFNEANTKLNETLYEQKRVLQELAIDQKIFNKTYTKEQGDALKAELEGIEKKRKANTEYEIAVDKITGEYSMEGNIDWVMERRKLRDEKLEVLAKKHGEEIANIELETKAAIMKINEDAIMEQMDKEDAANNKIVEKRKKDAEDYAKRLKAYYAELAKWRKEYSALMHQQEHEMTVFQKEEADNRAKQDEDELARYLEANQKKIEAANKLNEYRKKHPFDKIATTPTDEEREVIRARAKEVEDAVDHVSELEKIEQEHQKKMSDLKMQQIANDQKANQDNIAIQTQLAAKGLNNTLAYEIKRKNELEKSRQEELEKQKKRAQEEQAIEYALAFVKAYENYIGKDKTSRQALILAAEDVFAAKIIGKAVAAYKDGVEGLSGPGTETSDSIPALLSVNESVITAKGTKDNPGLATAMNKGMVDEYFESIYKPQYNSEMQLKSDVSKKSQVDSALVGLLINKFEDLKKTIQNKREDTTMLDNMGNVIKTQVESGISKTTIKKTFLS